MAEIHNNRMNSVGHGGTLEDFSTAGQHANFADIGFANHKHWQIDFFHLATKKCVSFRAFISDFQDSFNSNWDSENVYGRMDDIRIFKGVTRTITFSWAVPSISAKEARKNLHKFEQLSALLYPTYETRPGTGVRTLAGSPLLKIKFGNLIQNSTVNSTSPSARIGGLTGVVDGFNMAPDMDSGFFTPSPGIFLPKIFKVDCTFNVIHQHELGWNTNSGWLTHPKDKFPYGLHEQTGEHSICRARTRRGARNSKSKTQSSRTTRAKHSGGANMCLEPGTAPPLRPGTNPTAPASGID